MKKVDLTGRKFGNLLVAAASGRDTTGKSLWRCTCVCGATSYVTGLNLKSGNTKSCGCGRHRRGPDNPRTITDRSRIAERKRTLAAHRAWRTETLARNRRCLKCGSGSNLHVHHLTGYADSPEMRVDPDNGAVLCGGCHMAFHTKYGRRTGFSEADFCEFVGGYREAPPKDNSAFLVDTSTMAVIKYVTRHASKNGAEDLRKAIHYCQLLLELEYGEKPIK